MTGMRCLIRWAVPLAAPLAAVALAGAPCTARAGETVRVITHTVQYCAELAARARTLGAEPHPPTAVAARAEAQLLVTEADRLCAHGQIRPGIIRLRRAIMLLRGQVQPTPAE